MRVGGGRDDEEVSRKLKSMDVDKLENGGGEESPRPPRPAVKYHGWKAMPFIIGACAAANCSLSLARVVCSCVPGNGGGGG
jgi:hypothetical protein